MWVGSDFENYSIFHSYTIALKLLAVGAGSNHHDSIHRQFVLVASLDIVTVCVWCWAKNVLARVPVHAFGLFRLMHTNTLEKLIKNKLWTDLCLEKLRAFSIGANGIRRKSYWVSIAGEHCGKMSFLDFTQTHIRTKAEKKRWNTTFLLIPWYTKENKRISPPRITRSHHTESAGVWAQLSHSINPNQCFW